MPRSPKLNWEPSRGKWKAVYRGKKYRFDGGAGKSDREAKKAAEAEFRRVRGLVDAEVTDQKPWRQEYERALSEWKAVLRWSIENADLVNQQIAKDTIAKLDEQFKRKNPPPLRFHVDFVFDPTTNIYFGDDSGLVAAPPVGVQPSGLLQFSQDGFSEPSALWRDRLDSLAKRSACSETGDSFEENVQLFLTGKREEVDAGDISPGRVDFLRGYLDIVMEFTTREASVRKIDGPMLYDFRQFLLKRKASGEYSPSYARDVLAAFKQFIRWLASSTDKLESLPKNIDEKSLSIGVPAKKVKTLSPSDIGTIVNDATERTRLYILLGLNCAMTQKDIADLHPKEVDWKLGIITRKRSKTHDIENVPEVSYPLWKSTFALLTAERSDSKDRVLVTRDGKPLRTDSLDEADKLKKTDAVRLALRRLSQKVGIEFSMTRFKKTAASLFRNDSRYKGIESLYLDHAPKSMSDKHYTAIPQDLLNEAIAWLGRELSADDIPKLS